MIAYIKDFLDKMIYRFKEAPKGLDFARNRYPYRDEDDNVWYERTHPRHIREIFSYFDNRDISIIDLGCGKGFALYRLVEMGFARADGVEYDKNISAIARQNLKILKLEDKAAVFNMDARDFTDFDRYGVAYMFHPFRTTVMRKVIANLEKSLERAPRRFTVVYFNPVEHRLWSASPFFTRREKRTMFYYNNELDVYYYEHDPNWQRPSFSEVLNRNINGR